MSQNYLQFPAAPNLAIAPPEWDTRFQEQFSNTLRLYFNQISRLLQQLAGPQGGYHISNTHAAVQRTTDLVFTADTATLVTFDTNDSLLGMTNDGTDGIVVSKAGIYNYQFSVQFRNAENKINTGYIWLRINGVDVPGTTSKFDVPSSHGGGDGFLIGAANFFVQMNPGDYVSMYAAVSDVDLTMDATVAQTTPFVCPSIPAVVATLSFVSAPAT